MKDITLKDKLLKGQVVFGTWCEIPSPELIHVVASGGMDFVIIDMEHSSMDFQIAGQMVMAAEVEGCSPLIRVSKNDDSAILRALEVKPEGILVPHIDSAVDRKKVIQAAKFAPIGNRSLNPYVRAGGYRSRKDFTKSENDRTITGILVESLSGVKNINSIISDDNLDLIYLGSYDLSVALGCPGETKNHNVLNTLEKLTKIITKKGKIVGSMFHDQEELNYFKKIGTQFLCYKVDTSILFDEIARVKKLI